SCSRCSSQRADHLRRMHHARLTKGLTGADDLYMMDLEGGPREFEILPAAGAALAAAGMTLALALVWRTFDPAVEPLWAASVGPATAFATGAMLVIIGFVVRGSGSG